MDFNHDKKRKHISFKEEEDSSSSSTPMGSENGDEEDKSRPSPSSFTHSLHEKDIEEEGGDASSSVDDVSSDSSSVTHTRHSRKKVEKKRGKERGNDFNSEEDEEGDGSASSSSLSSSTSASISSFSSSKEGSSSSGSEAEIIIGEEPAQEMDEPLVRPLELRDSLVGIGKTDGRSTFFLTNGPHDEDDNEKEGGRRRRDGAGRLMLTDRPSPRDSLLYFIDTLATIGEETFSSSSLVQDSGAVSPSLSRLRNVVLIGSLHHGKTSFLRLLLSAPKEGNLTTGNSSHRSPVGADGSMTPFPFSRSSSENDNIPGHHESVDEIERGVTIKSHVITTIARGNHIVKSAHLLTLIDTPGHADLFSEAAAAMRLADAAVLCVDVVESLLSSGEALIARAIQQEHIPIMLVLTKLDRLIVELKLPPVEAYRKLRHVVDSVNNVISQCCQSDTSTASASPSYLVSPENGTVCFSSAALGFCFSLETFAYKYAEVYKGICSPSLLSRQLWGQKTLEKHRFQAISSVRQKPSFVQLVLDPLYKIVSHAVCGSGKAYEQLGLEEEGGDKPCLPRSPLLAIREAMHYFCGSPGVDGLDALLACLPPPHERSRWLLRHYQLAKGKAVNSATDTLKEKEEKVKEGETFEQDIPGESTDSVFAIAPLVRLYNENEVAAVVRVLHGTLKCRDSFVVVDDSCGEDAPYYTIKIKQLFLLCPEAGDKVTDWNDQTLGNGSSSSRGGNRRRGEKTGFLPVSQAREHQVVFVTGIGNRSGSHLVLMGGPAVASLLSNTHELNEEEYNSDDEDDKALMNWLSAVYPPRHFSSPYPPLIHVDIELKDPKKMDFIKDCLELLQRTTPGVDIHRQETGEFTLRGHGEFHLDVLLRELRQVLAPGIRLGVSPPYVSFSETVEDEEGILALVGSRRSAVGCVSGIISSPDLAHAMEKGKLPVEKVAAASFSSSFPSSSSSLTSLIGTDQTSKWVLRLRQEYGLDALDAQHIMGLGPDPLTGPNIFIDDTLEEERQISKDGLSRAHREAIIAGFRAAVAAGPLVGEVVRRVRLQLIFADIDHQTKASVVLTNARTAARQALLGARPRLMEPILSCEILCSMGEEGMTIIKDILQQRRGVVLYELPIPATTLIRYQALIPAIDSFGLETQIRMSTHGQCFPSFRFYHWDVVPGDPYDGSVKVGWLDPAQGHELARDFVLKTRFRKGLSSQLIGGE